MDGGRGEEGVGGVSFSFARRYFRAESEGGGREASNIFILQLFFITNT